MEPVAVSSFPPDLSRVVTHYGMLSVSILIIQDKDLWESEGVFNVLTEFLEVLN